MEGPLLPHSLTSQQPQWHGLYTGVRFSAPRSSSRSQAPAGKINSAPEARTAGAFWRPHCAASGQADSKILMGVLPSTA